MKRIFNPAISDTAINGVHAFVVTPPERQARKREIGADIVGHILLPVLSYSNNNVYV